jgi:DNA replication protein DnaC
VSRAAVAKELVATQARALKMPGLGRVYQPLARQAQEEHWGYEEYLHEVLSAEQTSRQDSAVRHRLREARFPEMKTLDTFDFASSEGAVSAAQIAELARGEWITRADNIIFAGPIGTGKTHLAIALGVEAARQRRRVLFVRAADIAARCSKPEMHASWDACNAASIRSSCSCSTSSDSCPSTALVASCSSTC